MNIICKYIRLKTKGADDFIDITGDVQNSLNETRLKNGIVTVFVKGSTAGITTFEYEPGLASDMKQFYERLVPSDRHYSHDDTWGDANGFSHIRSAIQGPSLVVPFESGKLSLGTWQQIVLAEFDNRPREREIILQFIGE